MGDVLVSGAIEALAQQICVVTLEPFETRVETDSGEDTPADRIFPRN